MLLSLLGSADGLPWFVLFCVLVLFALLASNRILPVKVFVSLAAVFYLLGFIDLPHFLQSYVNPSVMTLILLLQVSLVLEKTTWLRLLPQRLFHASLSRTYGRMGLWVGLSSALLNNTAVVASLLSAARNNGIHLPSRVLLPMSYIAILGGTLTLIGTSTHLIINGLLVQAGYPPLAFFDFLYIGLPLLIIGTGLLMLLGGRLLPQYTPNETPAEDYFIEVQVAAEGVLVGQSVQAAQLRHLKQIFLVELIRGKSLIAPVSPDTVLEANDRLLFSGQPEGALLLKAMAGLTLPGLKTDLNQLGEQKLSEVVISHQSTLVGRRLKKANFRNKFDAAVVAINRGQERLTGRLGDVSLQVGDKLVLVTGHDFHQRENLSKNFYFVSPMQVHNPLNRQQSLWAGLAFFLVMALSALAFIPLFSGLLLLLAGFVQRQWLPFDELKRRFPLDLILTLGSALVIAEVMLSSGAADIVADFVMSLFAGTGVWGAFVGIYLLTMLMTETITNSAAAALAFPIALATANGFDVSITPFILVVAYGASASFLTPYGYQTNLMVYTPGQYCFRDYVRMGWPLSLVYSLTVLFLTPWIFPF